ncbi:MAG: hypothetical protein INR62_05150, partial [Rhodospirillales bacterium]|nr:hypothetical protein [Acetobacter sp.]
MLSLPATVLALCVSHALGSALAARDSHSTTMPAPLAIHPDENWDGIDGQWSSFTLRIGTPEQFVRTFVSWSSYQTWAVLPQGCLAAADEEACADSRGGLFNQSASHSWDNIGIYDLWIKRNLGINGNAIFGYDSVGLGGAGEEGPTLQNTTVGAMALESFYLGIFGINPKPTNFTSFNDGSPSYMTKLKEQNYIPSVSFGYTAGAQYKFSGEYASLTLGGYDEDINGDPMEFVFAGDNERDILPAIQSISTPSSADSSPVGTELLPAPIYAYLDATVAEIWLPISACHAFEDEFGLVYDNTTDLYLVNDSLHDTLLSRNPSITFTLGAGESGGQTVAVELPYAAFDQTAKPPYGGLTNDTKYFPLRRAQNETQYTIGRVFFQEAYISVDYESQRFNVSQRVWNENSTPHLIAIPPYTGNDRSYPGATEPDTSSGLSGGAIAGIVVGVVAVLAILAGLLIWHFRRRSKAAKKAANAAAEQEKLGSGSDSGSNHGGRSAGAGAAAARAGGDRETVIPKAELDATTRFGATHYEADKNGYLSPSGGGYQYGSDSGIASSVSGSSPRTPNGTLMNFRDSAHYSPSSPSAGEGTHSSSEGGASTMMSAISPIHGHGTGSLGSGGPGGWVTTATEADGRERRVYEMAGDMPV